MTQSIIGSGQQLCATCAKWCGTRDIGLARNQVIIEHSGASYSEVKARCAHKLVPMYAAQHCSHYTRWDALSR